MDEIESLRKNVMAMSERRIAAKEVLEGIIAWFKETKPSELLVYETGAGKERTAAIAVGDPQMRDLWQKWADTVVKTVFDKGMKVPDMMLNDLIEMFGAEARKSDAQSK